MKQSVHSPVRRVIAGFLVFAMTAYAAEALAGEIRDGEVHHETATEATTHHDVQGSQGDHGHEDVNSSDQQHEHGPDHQHGTSVDHCTHAHGVGLPSTVVVTFAAMVVNLETIDALTLTVQYHRHHSPPPKA